MLSATDILTWSVLAFQLIGALASPVSSPSSNVVSRANVAAAAEDFVLTPAGPFLESQVHAVPAGGRVEQKGQTIHLLSANGTTLSTTKLTSINRSPLQRRNLPNGYVVLAYWSNGDSGSPINSFTTTWTVPQVPEVVTGQTIFIFNGLEPSQGDAILQPVLQWGPSAAGGGNYWAVSSWWVTGSGAFFSPPVQVSVGQSLTGIMTLQSITTSNGVSTYNYNSVFTGISGSSLSISSNRVLPLAFEALEIYNTQAANGLPRGRTQMRQIDIVKRDGTRPTVSWVPTANTGTGFSVQAISNSVPNGQVDIIYPLQ